MDENTHMQIEDNPCTSLWSKFHKLPKIRKKFWQELVYEYCKNASCDGVHYLTQHNRHWFERLFWVIVLSISIVLGSSAMHNTWRYWKQFPVFVSFSEKPTHIAQIPFPAVTICPIQKSSAEIFNFTEIYYKMQDCDKSLKACGISELEQQRFLGLSQICYLEHYNDIMPKIDKFIINTTDVIQILNDMAPENNILYCSWAKKNCTEQIQKVATELGICFTFNALNANELFRENNTFSKYNLCESQNSSWNPEKGYKLSDVRESYPFRVYGIGSEFGLNMAFYGSERNLDYLCLGSLQGYAIQLHAPDELPQKNKMDFHMTLDEDVYVTIRPNVMSTGEDLHNYKPEDRQCFFNDERYLRYFRYYNQNNCEIECVANYTLEKCGCVRFSVPVTIGTRICTAAEIECALNAEDEVNILEVNEVLADTKSESMTSYKFCDCLPSCNSISYSNDVSQGKIFFEQVITALKIDVKKYEGFHISRMKLFFKDKHFHKSKRSERYGTTEFVADCGGLLGLFLGVSLVSVIELFYYCTLRVFVKKKFE